jgi:heme exporter protein C
MRKLFLPLLIVTAAMFAYAPVMIAGAPYESTMLLVQKIFYFHVPAWFAMFTAVFVAGFAGAWFMARGDERGDRVAVSASEIALLFGGMGLTSGPIWAKRAWGVAWQWDAKLTIALLLELIFVSYLLLRKYGGAGSEKLAAAVALFGMAVVPFVYYAVNLWRTIHPANSVIPSLQAGMFGPFWFCVATFMLFLVVLLSLRIRVEHLRADLDELYRAEET